MAREIETPYLHVGGDESWNNAVCPECRARHGDLGAGNVMVEHFNRLSRIVKDMGKRAMIWADMPFYYPGSIDRLDRDIVMVDWHYDQQMDPYPPQPLASHTRFASLEAYLDKGFTTIFATASGPNYFPSAENVHSFCRYADNKPLMGMFNTIWELFDVPYDLCYPALAYGGEAAITGRPADPNEFLARSARKHFSGDTSALGDVVKAVGELRSATAAGTLGRMEYFVSFDLMNRIAMAPCALAALRRIKPKTDVGRGYRAGAEIVFRRAAQTLQWQKAINEIATALRDGDFASTKSPLKVLEAGVKAIPAMIQAERKWWNRDRYQEHENRVETFLAAQAKTLREFVADARAVLAGRKKVADVLPAMLQLWMTVDAPMWAETTIEVSPDGVNWTSIYSVPQCEQYVVGPRNMPFRHAGEIRQLRITVAGIGGFVMHCLKLIFPDRPDGRRGLRVLTPKRILSQQGAVTGAENLLTDDRRPTVFGDYEHVKYFKNARPQPPCVVTMEVG